MPAVFTCGSRPPSPGMSKQFTGLLIAAGAMARIVAIATTLAKSSSASFTVVETTRHARVVAFATAMKRAVAEHRTARAKCELLVAAEKNICDADAKKEQQRAKTEARTKYKGNTKSAEKPTVNETEKMRGVDLVLYRAHQQLDDSPAVCFADGGTDFSVPPGKPFLRIAINSRTASPPRRYVRQRTDRMVLER